MVLAALSEIDRQEIHGFISELLLPFHWPICSSSSQAHTVFDYCSFFAVSSEVRKYDSPNFVLFVLAFTFMVITHLNLTSANAVRYELFFPLGYPVTPE